MKKIFKRKKSWIILAAVLLLLVGGVSFYLYRNNLKKREDEKMKAAQEEGKFSEEKGDDLADPGSENDYQTIGGTTPSVTSQVETLGEVSLTVYFQSGATTSQDGKTTIPAGSLAPYFYLPSGIYSVQKLTGGVWKDVATNIQYPGHGGLAAGYTGPSEDNVSYRVLKIEGSTVKSISKTFVVKRSDLNEGVKTYN